MSNKIALLVKEFTLKKKADGPFQRFSEPYFIAFAIDGQERTPWEIIGATQVFPKVRAGDRITFDGEGYLLHKPRVPKDFLFYSILFMESDSDIRKIGETVSEAVQKGWKDTGAARIFANNPTGAAVAAVGEAIIGAVSAALSANRDDELFRRTGTFFQDTTPPFEAGRQYQSGNEYIDFTLKIRALSANQDLGSITSEALPSPLAKKS